MEASLLKHVACQWDSSGFPSHFSRDSGKKNLYLGNSATLHSFLDLSKPRQRQASHQSLSQDQRLHVVMLTILIRLILLPCLHVRFLCPWWVQVLVPIRFQVNSWLDFLEMVLFLSPWHFFGNHSTGNLLLNLDLATVIVHPPVSHQKELELIA